MTHTAHPPSKPTVLPPSRSAREQLSLREVDNRAIRLIASHHDLSIRDTVHQIVTYYLSSHDIDLGRIFADPNILSDQHLDKL